MPRTNHTRTKNHSDRNIHTSPKPLSDSERTIDEQAPIGLYDYPPDDAQSREYVTGRRTSRPTARNIQYRGVRASQERIRRKSNDTRARNRSLGRSQTRETGARPRRIDSSLEREGPDTADAQAVSGTGGRGRPATIHVLSLSSTPEPGDNGPEQPTQTPDNTQPNSGYETLSRETLVQVAREEFNLSVGDCDTSTIIRLIRVAKGEQTPQVGPSRRPPSIVMLSPTPFAVGGGWSQNLVGGSQATNQTPKRRGSQSLITANDSDKRQRTIPAEEIEDDTATEPETDDEPVEATDATGRLAAHRLMTARAGEPTTVNGRPRIPQRGTQAPPPSRDATPATVIDSQLSSPSSHSLGGSIPPRREELSRFGISISPDNLDHLAESLINPLTGPAHLRLRSEMMRRFLQSVRLQSEATTSIEQPDPQPDNVEEVPETVFDSESDTSQRATHGSQFTRHSYSGSRSHRTRPEPRPESAVAEPIDTNNGAIPSDALDEPHGANSLSLTPAQLIRRERARAIAAQTHAETTGRTLRRSRVGVAPASQPPTSNRQVRPPIADKRSVGMSGSRRLDPAAAARRDMIAFNRAVAQGEATSLIQSVTRQSERTARRSPPPSRSTDELLEDDEESIVQAEAFAKRRWPLRPSRVRKIKPLARDVSGLDRQVLIMAKIHLFAYALVEGIYQTRATFLLWSSDIHESTAQVEVPDRPYNKPPHEIYEIMVNSIATKRGKAKEHLREFVARVSGFCQNMRKQAIIQQNIERFNELYPNTFHCSSSNPRRGDYEHPEIGHCIALIIFHGPNSVGVLYPEYFREMPLTAVAFCLAIWMFCLEEWANGWRQNGDLSAGAMREKYEAQLAGLKELRRVAPRRMTRLQNEWRDYVVEYSGALLVPTAADDTDSIDHPQMRPDTPETEKPISVEEMDRRLLETARQESIRERMEEIAAQDLAEPMDVDDNDDDDTSRPQGPSSRAPTPVAIERNEFGVITACSKGKGRKD